MKVSIFTPSHKPDWLLEAYLSLIGQTHQDWEWIIQPNGPLNGKIEIPEDIRKNPKVRVLPYTVADGIGCLKKICCLHATGEVFVELDHDDWLTPDALAQIVWAAKQEGVGFVYSDSVHYFEDMSNEVFSTEFGWQHYNFEWEGKTHVIMKSFSADARSLCEIYWSPNHVRAWTREAYEKTGGHSGQLRVGDDHDLMCRTYLAGYKFFHITKPIYFYRRFKNSMQNSFVVENERVQEQQFANKDKYLHELIFEQCKRDGKMMIDLGGAHNCPKHKGFMSLDLHDADIVCDVTSGIPVEDNSVGCFRAQDFLEHIPIPEVPKLMNHLYQKLSPGGFLISGTPAVCDNEGRAGRGAYQDPTHVSYWSSNNFWYYTDKNFSKYVPEIKCRFQAVRLSNGYSSPWHKEHLIPYVWADLMALKGQRVPGRQLI